MKLNPCFLSLVNMIPVTCVGKSLILLEVSDDSLSFLGEVDTPIRGMCSFHHFSVLKVISYLWHVENLSHPWYPSDPGTVTNLVGPHRCFSSVCVFTVFYCFGHFGPFVYRSFCRIIPCVFVGVLNQSPVRVRSLISEVLLYSVYPNPRFSLLLGGLSLPWWPFSGVWWVSLSLRIFCRVIWSSD